MPAYSGELLCVLACLRWPLDETAITQLQAAAARVQDWQRFLAIVSRHRVTGLVANAMRKANIPLPEAVRVALGAAAADQTRQAMVHAAETIRLDRLLRGRGIEPVFLKGAAITMLAYGRLDLRHILDVDMLVPRSDVEQVVTVLRDAGYLPAAPATTVTPHQLRRWLRFGKSMDWVHSRTGAQLDLHWQLSDLPLLDAAITSDQRQQVLLAPGASVATLEHDLLFAFLCMHGTSHGWGRLKWLADVYAMLPQQDPVACEAVYRRATALHAGRSAGQAILLCDIFFGLSLSDRFRAELLGSGILRYLTQPVLRLLAHGGETEEVTNLKFASSSAYMSRFLLGNSLRAASWEAKRHLFPSWQTSNSKLPDPLLLVLFPFVRAFTLAKKYLRPRSSSNTHT